jgi:hypothetical protein
MHRAGHSVGHVASHRLVGTMRLAVRENLVPRRYALGAAAALARLDPAFLRSAAPAGTWLEPLWGEVPAERHERDTIIDLIEDGWRRLKRWYESGFQDLEGFFPRDN